MPQGLLNDVLFKIVFGVQNSEPVLIALLNALLGYTGSQKIVSLTIVNPTLDKEYLYDKGAVLDLKAVDGTGRWYNIEVQLEPGGPEGYHVKRSLYYVSKLYSDQLKQGQSYVELAKSIHISLLDFVLFPDSEKLHSEFHFREAETNTLLSDTLELHYIELKKFSTSKPHALRTPFEKWLYILKFSELYIQPEAPNLTDNLLEEEGIQMAIDSMQKAYARDEVREFIRAREKARTDYLSSMKEAQKQGLAEGLAEGRAKGLAEGLAEGRTEGLAEGRAEVARQMLARGLDLTLIQEMTGLSESELAALAPGPEELQD